MHSNNCVERLKFREHAELLRENRNALKELPDTLHASLPMTRLRRTDTTQAQKQNCLSPGSKVSLGRKKEQDVRQDLSHRLI